MKSESSRSCFGTLILTVISLALIRYTLPAIWKILAGFFTGALYLGLFLIVALVIVLGYFTYRNLTGNRRNWGVKQVARVTRVEELHQTLIERLQNDLTLNQVSAEEYLQSEILMKERLVAIRDELIRLKDFASQRNQKEVSKQIHEYQQQLRETKDSGAREITEENLRLLQEKQGRFAQALEEIREKEGLMDLVYHSLLSVDEDLRFGRPVIRLFPDDVYRRFDLSPPQQALLPPLADRSHE